MEKYILSIDQSTQGTKALLLDSDGKLIRREDLPHQQIVNQRGWVEHNPEEIYRNTIQVVKNLLNNKMTCKIEILAMGITNQRETIVVWERDTGRPIYNAIVWQCARAEDVCKKAENYKDIIHRKTGLKLSPYFSAAKIAWVLENVHGAKEKAREGKLCYGTIDSWLVYRLTGGKEFRTDYSNASRTQLFNIHTLHWDEEICNLFGIPIEGLAQVGDSNECFGYTDFEGYLEKPIPIHSVLGDSHGALYGQECHERGMCKATYGTGSSVMMNIGERPLISEKVVTSIAWGLDGRVQYVLEGNINYAGAVITWLKDNLGMISSSAETEILAKNANPEDRTYLVPAFSGLGAPYWESDVKAILCGMSRTTKKEEIVKAALECIAFQVTDVVRAMQEESELEIEELKVDGGPTHNDYLMQFQSDILGISIRIPTDEELSGIGAAYIAGVAVGLYNEKKLFLDRSNIRYNSKMAMDESKSKYEGWKDAVDKVLKRC